MSDTYINESKKGWYREDGAPNNDQLKLGCLQRIATATELMAQQHATLVADRDRYKEWYEHEHTRRKGLELRLSAMRGVITKLRKKMASQEPSV